MRSSSNLPKSWITLRSLNFLRKQRSTIVKAQFFGMQANQGQAFADKKSLMGGSFRSPIGDLFYYIRFMIFNYL